MKVLMALAALIWVLAVISMSTGNPTAINAVVGIPLAAGLTWAVIFIADHEWDGD